MTPTFVNRKQAGMTDTFIVAPLIIVVSAVALVFGGYVALVLFLARVASHKWHPDGGEDD